MKVVSVAGPDIRASQPFRTDPLFVDFQRDLDLGALLMPECVYLVPKGHAGLLDAVQIFHVLMQLRNVYMFFFFYFNFCKPNYTMAGARVQEEREGWRRGRGAAGLTEHSGFPQKRTNRPGKPTH